MSFILEQLLHGGIPGKVGVLTPLLLSLGGVWAVVSRPNSGKLMLAYVGMSSVLANAAWIVTYCSWLLGLFRDEGQAADALVAMEALRFIRDMTLYNAVVLVLFLAIGSIALASRKRVNTRRDDSVCADRP